MIDKSTKIGISTSVGYLLPPRDPLREIFSPEVKKAWQNCGACASENLLFRLKVLAACGPYPSDPFMAAKLRHLRAVKAAWDTYLFAAYACGMFEGDRGKDVLGRLRSGHDDDFRSAMAECMTCWFLAGRLKLPVASDVRGRNRNNLDLGLTVSGVSVGVEIKAPFREMPKPPPGQSAVVWCGDDADKIEQCMETANKQFDDDQPNLLVIVPNLRMQIFSHRHDVVKAAYGQSKITFPMNSRTGESTGPMEIKFFPEGKFLNKNRPGGKPLKPDGFPAYRRISAVLCLEEKTVEKYPYPNPFALLDEEQREALWPVWEKARNLHFSSSNEKWIDHDIVVLHNPHAYHPLPKEPWGSFPQLMPVDGKMKWTDGYVVDV